VDERSFREGLVAVEQHGYAQCRHHAPLSALLLSAVAKHPAKHCPIASGELCAPFNALRGLTGARCTTGGTTGVAMGSGSSPTWEGCGLSNTVDVSTAGTVAFALEITVWSTTLTHHTQVSR
jgi:hypothetical protein